jgi:hypothetical protein
VCNGQRLRCVSDLMIFHTAYTVARNSVGAFDMAERQEPPNDVPRGANCLKSVLGQIQTSESYLLRIVGCFASFEMPCARKR